MGRAARGEYGAGVFYGYLGAILIFISNLRVAPPLAVSLAANLVIRHCYKIFNWLKLRFRRYSKLNITSTVMAY